MGPYGIPEHPIEFDLLLHQVCLEVFVSAGLISSSKAMDEVINDRFPLSPEEAAFLAGLRAQAELGDYTDSNISGLVIDF